MGDELEFVRDGDGVGVFGDAAVVERFLTSGGLASRPLDIQRFSSKVATVAGVTQAGSMVAATSGRCVQLTAESASKLRALPAMKGPEPGVVRAVLMKGGKTEHILQIAKPGVGMLTNPALLAGAAGVMAQLAMQQAMDEITDYLAAIDKKVDDVLRAQKDAVLAEMIGVGFVVDEAMTIREHVGHVSETTWSKVQSGALAIASTQAYAIRQLVGLAEQLERGSAVGEVAAASRHAQASTQEWLVVLARCFQLQDGLAILELDRVLDAAPDDLDRHRVALRAARQQRLEQITRATDQLVQRMVAASEIANAKVLLHPGAARTVVGSTQHVAGEIVEFHRRLGIDAASLSIEARRWLRAATDVRDRVVLATTDGALAVSRHFRNVDLDGDGIPDEARALTAVKSAAGVVANPFRRVDLDGDGVADDPRAVRAVKGAGGAVAGLFGSRRRAADAAEPGAVDTPGGGQSDRD